MSTIERAQKRKKRAQQEEAAQPEWKPDDQGVTGSSETAETSGLDPTAAAPQGASSTGSAVGPAAADTDTGGPLAPAGFEPGGPELRVTIEQLRRQSMYPPVHAEARLHNEYRRIKRPLLAHAAGKGAYKTEYGNRIMVTSAIQGEGKTFTALNLALSMAQDPDYSVTLVDADVARRDASRVLGVEDSKGLLDLLLDGSLDPADLARPTNIESLSVLPAGTRHNLSEELISSTRMRMVLERMSAPDPHHILLFDAPPILASPDAVSLADRAGQVVVVVKAGSTARQNVTAAVDQLDPDKAVNMVLNQSLGGAGGDEYGGYYGYGSA